MRASYTLMFRSINKCFIYFHLLSKSLLHFIYPNSANPSWYFFFIFNLSYSRYGFIAVPLLFSFYSYLLIYSQYSSNYSIYDIL
ncbi:hypothetical protein CW304_05610 [Bacillus sp. UFRGS-B20]|nr:hypothetical protein CW304_05610 [Bacillus sp. UFRGS-B20]